MRTERAIRSDRSATTSPRAVCTKLYRMQADSSSLLALQPGSVQVWPARHPTASAGRRRDPRCGWGWWLSSFSGSNWDESADGTAAVNGFLRLLTWEQNGSNPGYFWREYTRNAAYLVFAFCRIADAVNHMILCRFKTCRLEIIRPGTTMRKCEGVFILIILTCQAAGASGLSSLRLCWRKSLISGVAMRCSSNPEPSLSFLGRIQTWQLSLSIDDP